MLTSYSINYLLYYLQHKVQIVEAIWWEPETRSVCVEIYNWLKLWNIEGKHYFDQDKPNVIKIPQKYLSPTLYGPKETKMGLEFDFAQVNEFRPQEASLGLEISWPLVLQYSDFLEVIFFQKSVLRLTGVVGWSP